MIELEVSNVVFRVIQYASIDLPKTIQRTDRSQVLMSDMDTKHLVWAVFPKHDAGDYEIVKKKP